VPVEQALPIAAQIAEALEAAHDNGIIHRDLKPANVKVDAAGQVKVLDFGLARAFDPAVSNADLSASPTALALSPTLTARMTQPGIILGTAAYMSPEQARGLETDKRSDIWAYGVLLWEMLSGRKLFAGDTVSDVMAAVLKTEIDLDALPEDTPVAVRRLLHRCLERDPNQRLRDIGDARLELETPLPEDLSPSAKGNSTAGSRSESRSWLWWIGLLVAAGVGLLVGRWNLESEIETSETVQFEIRVPEASSIALAPDGKRL